jgi:hypothetical protein
MVLNLLFMCGYIDPNEDIEALFFTFEMSVDKLLQTADYVLTLT